MRLLEEDRLRHKGAVTNVSATGLQTCTYDVRIVNAGGDAEVWVEVPHVTGGHEWEVIEFRGVSEGECARMVCRPLLTGQNLRTRPHFRWKGLIWKSPSRRRLLCIRLRLQQPDFLTASQIRYWALLTSYLLLPSQC